ncbi:MAG: replication initiator protein [Microvirus sp.]|nr:MAG: replication initiator protein [Microvirus sp.]
MSCVKPLKAYWRSRNRDAITFDVNHSATRVPFSLPCGRCIGCRLEKARQWGLRCLHEKKMWADNAYVTLTYDDKFLPDGASLCLRDLQLFMKRLRKAREPSKVRFFAGGEYGDENKRPHYHLLLFNCDFKDKLFLTNNKRGEPLYTSKELSDLWFQGHSSIGEVTFDSAVYCAKYALKKVNGDKAFEHYNVLDADGCIISERVPEFAVMSRRPGIGATYYEKYGKEVLAHDSIIVNGRKVNPPRFYDIRSECRDPVAFDAVKRRRKRDAVLNRADNTPERLGVKEKLMIIAAEKKERKL